MVTRDGLPELKGGKFANKMNVADQNMLIQTERTLTKMS